MRSDALDCVQPCFLLAVIEMEGQKWSINDIGSHECILGDGEILEWSSRSFENSLVNLTP